jgi:thiol peroxidase
MANVTFKGAKVGLEGDLVRVGMQAPDFRLVDPKLDEHTLASFAGKTKILTINPSIDTGVCATTTRRFNERAAELPEVVVLAISADLPFALKRFCAAEGIDRVHALSSFRDPEMGVRYGLRMQQGPLTGLFARAVIVIDPSDVIRYIELVAEVSAEPDYDAALAAARG